MNAGEVVAGLERGEVAAVWERLAPVVRDVISEDRLRDWGASIDGWIGSPRRIRSVPSGEQLLEGPRGVAAVGVRFDAENRVTNIEIAPWVTNGIRNIVIGSPRGTWNDEANRVEGEPRELGEFYAAVLDMRILRDDWIVVGKDANSFPRLAFGDGWSDERPPRWRDPDYPAQVRLDFFTPDVSSARRKVLDLGATELDDDAALAVFADPFGHAFGLVLHARGRMGSGSIELGRVVFDCAEPHAVAAFWAELVDMHETVEETADRLVIARADGRLPMLGFERVAGYVSPRWGDPLYPEQMHLDLSFNDPRAARLKAEGLGATGIPPPRGSCPVYVDPAGHPFCLCSSAGTEEPFAIEFLAPP